MTKHNSKNEFYRILSLSVSKHLKITEGNNYLLNEKDDSLPGQLNFISSINITDSYNGNLFLFASKESLDFIFNIIFSSDYETMEKDNLAQDCMDEFLNLVIANSTEEFYKAGVPIHVGVPREKNKESAANVLNKLENGIVFETTSGIILFSFIAKNN